MYYELYAYIAVPLFAALLYKVFVIDEIEKNKKELRERMQRNSEILESLMKKQDEELARIIEEGHNGNRK